MLDITTPEVNLEIRPRIVVIGVGGSGGNAVENMIDQHLEGCEFMVANTDSQALKHSSCDKHIQLGKVITSGLGAGANPEVGRKAAEESIDEIIDYIDGANMVFIACGMGGGTGTGAAPIIARHAREKGILTVGVVSKPFAFEGPKRMKQADQGVIELQKVVDTLIVIPNQNLFCETSENTSLKDALKMVDEILYRGVRGVTDLMIKPGLINLDFNDIRAVMGEMGKAMMGTGEASGPDRAINAAENAINNKLLDDDNMKGATAVIINITASSDVSLTDVDTACSRVRQEVDEDASIIFGTTIDDTMCDIMRVSIVATGIDVNKQQNTTPIDLDIESPKPDVLFGEHTQTSDSFLNTLSAEEELEQSNDVEDSTDSIQDQDISTTSFEGNAEITMDEVPAPSMQEDRNQPQDALEMINPTAYDDNSNNPDPFLEADLANAVQGYNENTIPQKEDSEEVMKKGSFFKNLFGGIKNTKEPIKRTEPVIETTKTAESVQMEATQYNSYAPISSDGNLVLDTQTEDEMNIPAFLRKQIN